MKTRKVGFITFLILILAAAALLLAGCIGSNQASMPILLPVELEGEYSQNGGPWEPFGADTELSALDGDVIIRGHFKTELLEVDQINLYLNHIQLTLLVNGEVRYESSMEQPYAVPDLCGTSWESCRIGPVSAADTVELRICNPHRSGNADAYHALLNQLCTAPKEILEIYMKEQDMLWFAAALLLIITGILFIGVSIASALMRSPVTYAVGIAGISIVSVGLFILFDAPGISLWNDFVILNTYVRDLALMMGVYGILLFIMPNLHLPFSRIFNILVYASGVFDVLIFAAALSGIAQLHDLMYWWQWMNLLLCTVLLLCIIFSRMKGLEIKIWMYRGIIAVPIVLTADFGNAMHGWWEDYLLFKIVFTVVTIICVAKTIVMVPENYRAQDESERLRMELQNSRSVLAMSQIRQHFIFNVLNAVSGMCKYDPEKADEALIQFARYLRSNVDVMEDDQPIAFMKELAHLHDYIALEQIRFGSKIEFMEDIEVEDFLIPPLVLQPLIENSIKHGLLTKSEGGRILLHTRQKEKGGIEIIIEDNGTGFDVQTQIRSESVGLKNVKFRLEYMAGGTMHIQSTPGQGTAVTITLPEKEK